MSIRESYRRAALHRAARAALGSAERLLEAENSSMSPVQNKPTKCAAAHHGAPRRTIFENGKPTAEAPRALEPRQVMAVRLLLAGRGTGEVGATLGVTRHTVARWKKDPMFQEEVRRMSREVDVTPGP